MLIFKILANLSRQFPTAISIVSPNILYLFSEYAIICEFPPETNEQYYQLAFPVLIDYVREVSGAKLVEKNKKLFLEMELPHRDNAVEILWRFKKTLELSD